MKLKHYNVVDKIISYIDQDLSYKDRYNKEILIKGLTDLLLNNELRVITVGIKTNDKTVIKTYINIFYERHRYFHEDKFKTIIEIKNKNKLILQVNILKVGEYTANQEVYEVEI